MRVLDVKSCVSTTLIVHYYYTVTYIINVYWRTNQRIYALRIESQVFSAQNFKMR